MSDIPSLIKSLALYFNYTEKLKANNPIIAYACLTYAVEKSFALVKANPKQKEAKKFLMSKLDQLQMIKGELGVKSKGQAKQKIQEFCVHLFVKINKSQTVDADITKKHALEFNRASHFIQTLSAFDALSEDWKQKLKYCQVKAAQISKDIREGKKPTRGNPYDPQNNTQEIEQNKEVGYNDPQDQGDPDPMQTAKDPYPQQQQQQQSPQHPKTQPKLSQSKIPQTFNLPLAQSTVSVGKVSSHGSVTPRTKMRAKNEAKKLADNGLQQLQFDNMKQALLCFEKAVALLKNVC